MMVQWLRGAYYCLPDSARNAVLVRRRESLWLSTGIVFIHIPKAAGTSISEALYGQFMGHVRAHDIKRWGSAKLNALPSFSVTRNPWGRAVSAYRYARRLREVDWRSETTVPRAVRREVPTFRDFAEFVNWLDTKEVAKLNVAFRPQWTFVCDDSRNIIVDHVGRLEALGETLDFLANNHRPMPRLMRANKSGEPVDYRSFYNLALAETIGRIYAADVELFGYGFDTE